MLEFKLPTAASHKITVSSTAGSILSFIETAYGSAINWPFDLSQIEIQPEDYSIRYTTDGTTPTAANGTLVSVGEVKQVECAPKDFKIIRAESSDAVCCVRVGWKR